MEEPSAPEEAFGPTLESAPPHHVTDSHRRSSSSSASFSRRSIIVPDSQWSASSTAANHRGGQVASDPVEPASVPDEDPAGKSSLEGLSDAGLRQAVAAALVEACAGQLGDIDWFRTGWQRGGALTGYALWYDEQGGQQPVVVKAPVPAAERRWLLRLQGEEPVVPRVYASGLSLGPYDLAWVVMERLPFGPVDGSWGAEGFDLVAEAAGRFYGVASRYPVEGKSREQDWEAVTKLARERVKTHKISQGQRWKEVLKKASKKLSKWIELWRSRPREEWGHGDLHLGNAMTRSPAPDGPALLFDFALTRRGHWVEDAVYFEHLFWARPDRLEGRNLCKLVSQARKAQGLPVGSDWAQLAAVRRAFLAISVPADLEHHSDPAQLDAALAVLEQQM